MAISWSCAGVREGRAVRTTLALKSEPMNDLLDKVPDRKQVEGTYSEALLPLGKTTPSTPVYEGKGSIITTLPTIVPFIYPQIQGTSGLNHETQRPLPHVL